MARNSDLQIQKEEDLKKDFFKLKAEKKYTTEYILKLLSPKYYLTERTIQDIVFGAYDSRRSHVVAK